MRLIDTTTLHLQEFFDSERPEYAILSHTWGKEEVSFHEWMEWEEGNPTQKARIETKSGFRKILNACRIAQSYHHRYIWIDTACIDKKSSAELSEAINSMFSWYRDSRVCYVYLEDFSAATPNQPLSSCRWFTRGWTLQELLAPEHVTFFNAAWESFGTKIGSLCREVSNVTGIDETRFRNRMDVNYASAAEKMSWASSRQTTRVEDMAYCLLGLFDINMPLMYGEGYNAFRRLQEEIIKVSTDQSLFAWDWPSIIPEHYRPGNRSVTVIAPFPSAFGKCHDVISDSFSALPSQPNHREYSMTNFGLNIALPLLVQQSGRCYAALRCVKRGLEDVLMCIPLSPRTIKGTYDRDHSRDMILVPRRFLTETPTSISIPRGAEPPAFEPGVAPRLEHQNLHREEVEHGIVRFLIFPMTGVLGTCKIWSSGEFFDWSWEIGQRLLLERKGIPPNIRTNFIVVEDTKRDVRWVFILLWAPKLHWWHVYSEEYRGNLRDDVADETLQRAVNDAPFPDLGKTSAYGDIFRLEVGFNYSLPNDSGERWLSMFLSVNHM